jgi:hypothetical protein
MPRPTKEPAEKLDKGVTVLFTKAAHEKIKNYARAHGISMGEAVRRLTDKALRT